MSIEEYYRIIEELADKVERSEIATHDYLEELINEKNNQIFEVIDFRKEFLDAKEQDQVRGYLVIGFFKTLTEIERLTCFTITLEVDQIKSKNSWKKRCECYSKDQPLFKLEPDLLNKVRKKDTGSFDNELINLKALEQINDSEIVKFNKSYSILDHSLNPQIVIWSQTNFPDKPIYVRVNPYKAFEKMPSQMLFESVLMPANPKWWKHLTIHNRKKEGASYLLDDCSPKDNYRQFWEFHIKNVNRLEVIAKRNNSSNLSMMIEEITNIDTHGLLFGRMIHLDSDSKFGTDFDQSTLNHLDLAINIYEGNVAQKRLEQKLESGNKTVDASYRTHLLRIESIPFKALFGYAISFFRSQTLINEWFADQFRE
ncbi:MAG: hypothetical protein AAGA02_00075 [Bacteroidota bacterium]